MKFLSLLALNTALLTLGAVTGCAKTEPLDSSTENAQKPYVTKTSSHSKGMIAAANPLAVESGLDILRQGGSAVDAAIAIQATLGLVEPQSSGLGGGSGTITDARPPLPILRLSFSSTLKQKTPCAISKGLLQGALLASRGLLSCSTKPIRITVN